MLKNYLKIALRNLKKHKGYSLINVTGLAIGMACCVLIVLYVQDELSYDRHHENADRIYRVLLDRHRADGSTIIDATTPPALAPALTRDITGLEQTVRIMPPWGTVLLVDYGETRFYEERVFLADPHIFDVFTYLLLQGNPETALADPDGIVLTEAMAHKYFGDDDPMGKTLTIGRFERDFTVTGVLENLPANIHFSFDFLLPLSVLGSDLDENWGWWNYYTYVLFNEDFDAAQFEAAFPRFIESYQGDRGGGTQELRLQALTDIHLRSNVRWEIEPNGDLAYVYIFSAIAVLTLLIACTNFMNLATARSAKRAREVGMRKVIGARRGQLIRQFLGESVLLSLFAVLLAIALTEFFLPVFNQLADKHLTLDYLQNPFLVITLIGGIVLFVGVLAGLYPAFFLSAFQPTQVLKGQTGTKTKGAFLRKGLVVTQFSISIFLIVGTFIIQDQLDLIQTKKLGFDTDQVVVVPVRDNAVRENYETFRQTLRTKPGIESVTTTSGVFGGLNWTTTVEVESIDEALFTNFYFVDYDFVETLGMEMADGRAFSRAWATDSSGILFNEAAVKHIGLEDPVGKQVQWDEHTSLTILGVVKDFHFRSLHHAIEPFAMVIGSDLASNIMVRVNPANLAPALAALTETWNALTPEVPFAYSFLDHEFAQVHESEAQLAQVFRHFAVLALFIACLGLFGLASFTAEQRTKEIGVRKALGATVSGIALLLSKDFARLVFASFIVASPFAYLAAHRWLQAFAFRIEISARLFLFAGLTALGIALLTVSYQAIRAALTNPVKALRHD